MILLDTSFLIRALMHGASEAHRLDGWIRDGEALGITSVAWCEFLCGPVLAADTTLARSVVDAPIPFTADDSIVSASLYNLTGRRRGSLVDCMIAAAAIRVAAKIATRNTADFRRFEPYGISLAIA